MEMVFIFLSKENWHTRNKETFLSFYPQEFATISINFPKRGRDFLTTHQNYIYDVLELQRLKNRRKFTTTNRYVNYDTYIPTLDVEIWLLVAILAVSQTTAENIITR